MIFFCVSILVMCKTYDIYVHITRILYNTLKNTRVEVHKLVMELLVMELLLNPAMELLVMELL